MNDENKSNYYAIIPASVRYDEDLTDKAKLLYGEITCLSNKEGYCFATNKYFSKLYHCSNRAIQNAISTLQDKGYIRVLVENNYQRKIFLMGTAGYEKIFIPPYEKNFIHNNIKYNIDDLFNLIINKSTKIPKSFYNTLNKLELIYTEKVWAIIQEDKKQVIKNIIYVLFEIYNSEFKGLISMFKRDTLINLYFISQEHCPEDLLNYYKRTLINKYTNNST